MDDKTEAVERSEEEVAWDEEFSETKDSGVAGSVGDLLSLVVKVPVALIQMPMELLPTETRKHTRAAVRESFLAVRSLLGAIGDGIEGLLEEPAGRKPTVSGPPGTWGTGRTAQPTFSLGMSGTAGSSKTKRIKISDEAGEDTAASESTDLPDDRGLRADIDY